MREKILKYKKKLQILHYYKVFEDFSLLQMGKLFIAHVLTEINKIHKFFFSSI